MKTLFNVALSLSKSGLIWKIKSYESYETEKTVKYKVLDKKEDGNEGNIPYREKTIHKKTLNRLSDKYLPSTTFIATSMFCYETDLEVAKEVVHGYILYHILQFKSDVDQLYLHIENENQNTWKLKIKESL